MKKKKKERRIRIRKRLIRQEREEKKPAIIRLKPSYLNITYILYRYRVDRVESGMYLV